MEKIIYTKYSNERAKPFAIRTDICADGGVRTVKKRACFPEGREHIASLKQWRRALTEAFFGTPFSVNDCVMQGETAIHAYLEGRTLEERLDEMLLAGDVEQTAGTLADYGTKVRAALKKQPFVLTPEFARVFGEAKLPDGLFSAAVTDIDMTVNNAIEQEGGWTLIDYEWTFAFPIPSDYVLYRILKYYIYGSPARAALEGFSLFAALGLTEKACEAFEKMEQHFQAYVRGGAVVLQNLYSQVSPGYLDIKKETKNALPLQGEFQIFYDRGDGFSAKDSVYISGSGEKNELLLIPADATVRAIRVDPPSDYCLLHIREAQFQKQNGEGTTPRCTSNGTELRRGLILFAAEDAQMIWKGWRPAAGTLRLALEMEAQDPDGLLCGQGKQTEAARGEIRLVVDILERTADGFSIQGWAVCDGRPAQLKLTGDGGRAVAMQMQRIKRDDVNASCRIANENVPLGFYIEAAGCDESGKPWKKLTLTASDGARAVTKILSVGRIIHQNSAVGKKLAGMLPGRLRPTVQYLPLTRMGFWGEEKNAGEELLTYAQYRKATRPDAAELDRQRKETFPFMPLISVAVPLYNTPAGYLKELLDSLLAQTYEKLEICLADGSSTRELEALIRRTYPAQKRIRYQKLKENLGISGNTNAALSMAAGDYVVLADHDDLLEADAFYEIVKTVNEHPQADFIYTDEDKVSADGTYYYGAHFKPDFNLYMLRSNNYICHITAVKRELAQAVGFREAFDGSQDHDFILRCCERAREIRHIPKVLYHWRSHADSTAGNIQSKTYTGEAGRRAVQEHYRRLGIDAVVEPTELFGRFRTRFAVKGKPKVSVIIPNKDHVPELKQCLDSIAANTVWDNYEVIVVENNSEDPQTAAFYRELPKRYEKVRLLTWEGAFHFSAINNFAAAQADGEYLLFLNNDAQVITPGWMETMLGICSQEDVGAVGAKLLYPDGTIQHAGIVIGLCGVAGHIFSGMPAERAGYMGRAVVMQEFSAVTAACMMTKRRIFERVGGFDEAFAVAYNDVDYCMKLAREKQRVVFTPDVMLYHHESSSRGGEDTPQKKERFLREAALFEQRWPDILKNGDPCYNINLTRTRGNCLPRVSREGV